jgi:hypothetical protein
MPAHNMIMLPVFTSYGAFYDAISVAYLQCRMIKVIWKVCER